MTLADNLIRTINETFELYKTSAKKFYTLSLTFSILFSIFAIVISLIICFVAANYLSFGNFEYDSLWDSFISNPIITQRFNSIIKAIMIFNFGLYAIFLLQEEEKGFEEKYNFKNLIKGISKDSWNKYFALLGLLLFINIIFFKDIFNTTEFNNKILGFDDYYDPTNKKFKLYGWLNSLLELIKMYLPYIFAMIFIMYRYVKKIDKNTLRKFKNAILSVLILSFVMNVVSNEIIFYLNTYIIYVFKIPFINEIIPVVFGSLIGILILAFFYLAFAAIIAYPIKYESEENIIE